MPRLDNIALFEVSEFVPEQNRLYWGGPSRELALQLWREESCAEFTAERHAYMLLIEEGSGNISCDVCGHNPLELGDLNEFLYFGPIPVDVQIVEIVHPGGPWGGTEYDVEVEVTPR